jgi:uncharacterized membrane protein YdcZ (DUF606 family)
MWARYMEAYNPTSSANVTASLISFLGLFCLGLNAYFMGRDQTLPSANPNDKNWFSWTAGLALLGVCLVCLGFVLMYMYD